MDHPVPREVLGRLPGNRGSRWLTLKIRKREKTGPNPMFRTGHKICPANGYKAGYKPVIRLWPWGTTT